MTINFYKTRFALTQQGAKDFNKAVWTTVLQHISFMLPMILVFLFLEEYLRPVLNPSAGLTHGISYYLIMSLGFIVVMYLLSLVQYNAAYTKIYAESANRRISLAEKLRKLPLSFFGEKNLSDLTATIMEDATMLEQTFSHQVPQLFASLVSITLMATGLFFYNWQLSLALFWVVPIAALVMYLGKKRSTAVYKKSYHEKRNITEQIQEGLETIQEMKSYNIKDQYISKLDKDLTAYEKLLMRVELVPGAFMQFAQMILKVGFASVIILGTTLLMQQSIDLLTFFIFLLVASRIYAPIEEALIHFAILTFLDIRINRMKEMEAMPMQSGKTDFKIDNYDITFDNVHFSYEEGKKVLNGVSFTAKQGEVTALVGPSGGGKSTTAKLAARFWDIDSGKITLGGEDISQIDPEALMKHYSIVFQDVVLFNNSVKENIRIGKPDATDEEVQRVATLAQCDEFVSKLPEGYETAIGENGQRLSGGERQRISIARALLKDAPIVLLDEATASIDVENETKIQAGISELVKNKTVLIIAHRMRTVANANKIVTIKNGKAMIG